MRDFDAEVGKFFSENPSEKSLLPEEYYARFREQTVAYALAYRARQQKCRVDEKFGPCEVQNAQTSSLSDAKEEFHGEISASQQDDRLERQLADMLARQPERCSDCMTASQLVSVQDCQRSIRTDCHQACLTE